MTHLRDGSAENAEAFRIISPIDPLVVGLRMLCSVRNAGSMERVQGYLGVRNIAHKQAWGFNASGQVPSERSRQRNRTLHSLGVGTKSESHVVSQRLEKSGQTAHRIGGAAGLDTWLGFTGGKWHSQLGRPCSRVAPA